MTNSTPILEEKIKNAVAALQPSVERLWQVKYKFLFVNFIIAIIASIYLLLFNKLTYESTVTILPDYGSKSMLGGLSDLAAMAGIVAGSTDPADIYQNLITSEAVLEPVIYTKYLTEEYKDSVNLITYFDIEVKEAKTPKMTERKRFLRMYTKMNRSILRTSLDNVTRILVLTVAAPESKLSSDIANNIIEELDRYVRVKRKSYASNQRFYLEKRLRQVKDSLTTAEETLMLFRLENRQTTHSPELMLEQERRIRNVQISQTVYIELTKQLELVKIDEIRDAPVLNVKEYARDPIVQSSVGKKVKLAVIMFFAVVLSALYFVYKETIDHLISLVWEGLKSKTS